MLKVEYFLKNVFLIFLIIILGSKALYLLELLPRSIAILGIVLVVSGCVFVCVNITKWRKLVDSILEHIDNISQMKLCVILISIVFFVKIVAICVFRIDSISNHPDIMVYVENAYELATKGYVEKYAGYCWGSSHMFWFSAFLTPCVKVFGDTPMVLSIYMAIISTLSIWFLFDTMSNCFSKSKAFVVLFVFGILPSQILLPQYITHEHALLFFASISVWLYFRVFPIMNTIIKKSVVFILFVLSIVCANQVNSAAIVLWITYFIIFVLQSYRENEFKANIEGLVKCLVLIIVFFLSSYFCSAIQKEHSILSSNYYQTDKYAWTLFVGSNVESKGMWNQADVDYFDNITEGLEQEDAYKAQRQAVLERYTLLLKNPLDVVKLIQAKLTSQWSVFTYSIMFSNETITNIELRQFYQKYLDRLLVLIEYGMSLIAVYSGISAISSKRNFDSPDLMLFFELYLMGVTALCLLTECNNKYTISMQPFYWLACFCSYKNVRKLYISSLMNE